MSVSDLTSKPPPDPTLSTRPNEAAAKSAREGALGRFCHRYALIFAWAATIVLFGFLEPGSFLQLQNFTSMFNSQAVLVVLTCSLVLTLTSSEYDLSAASVLSLSAMVVAVLNAQHQVPVGWAILVALAAGLLVGTVNSVLIVVIGIESIIATLGMGSLISGITLWISGSNMISGISNTLVTLVIVPRLFGISLGFVYAVAIAAALWYFLTYTPFGRQLLFVGRGRRVARLSGLPVGRLRFGAMVGGSFLAAVAGVLYAGTSASADPNSGDSFMLPAFAAAFLGSTSIVPGRFNAWGSFAAVYFLVTGIYGLSLMGIQVFVQNLFYGGALIIAVGLSILVRRSETREPDIAKEGN
ncbi:ABC transporter permease [Rhodopila sp.]|uniref:ABC transporter permease n=1 Tax=Rhodopila sp. TaxID=2480087 RepID=UPI003D12F5CA